MSISICLGVSLTAAPDVSGSFSNPPADPGLVIGGGCVEGEARPIDTSLLIRGGLSASLRAELRSVGELLSSLEGEPGSCRPGSDDGALARPGSVQGALALGAARVEAAGTTGEDTGTAVRPATVFA